MKHKLCSRRGMTLTEVLVALLILSLVTGGVAAGVGASLRVYRQATEASDAQMLASTLSAALMDELRYARDVEGDAPVIFTSDTFGEEVSVGMNADGRVTVGSPLLLSDAVYGVLTASADVRRDGEAVRVELTVQNGQGETVSGASFSVVPLNG